MISIPGLPNPALIAGALVAVVVSYGIGHHQGYASEHDLFVAFQGEVKATGEAAEAAHKVTIANHEAVTAKVVADSTSKLAALQAQADNALKVEQLAHVQDIQSLQETHAVDKQQTVKGIQNVFETKVAAIHAAYAGRLLGVNANTSSGAVPALSLTAPPAYDRAAYDVLAANCAVTTQMLISLQEWVATEGAVQ